MGKFYFILTLLLCSSFTLHSQCAEQQTYEVCDITVVDNDNDGTPDGIINLYDELSAITGTTITTADGMFFDPEFTYALDVSTGDLYTWDLSESSENVTDYQFEFIDSSSGCPDDVRYLFNIVIGPFAGTAASTAGGGVNLQVCQGAPPSACGSTTSIDLFQTMQANPNPHSNGTWKYMGSSPNFISITDNRFLNVNVPYEEGPPLVDEETFELEYTVKGIVPCAAEDVTSVIVSVVKEPFAGFANDFVICESDILNGTYNGDIDLRDDAYLVNENIEGVWLDTTDSTGQISGPGDSVVNLREVYDNLVATNPRFGCATFQYTYYVESRSTICSDQQSSVTFTFYEYIRPFEQDIAATPELCVGDDSLTTLNLYDYINFAQEGSTEFDYPNDSCTNWTFVSGPSDLGIVSNLGDICSLLDDPNYTSAGTIDVSNLEDNSRAGTYVFEFTVDESYHCGAQTITTYIAPDGCISTTSESQPCGSQTTRITLIVNPVNYAGEDTAGLQFCESEVTLTLTDLLQTNGTDTVYVGPDGVWTDLDNATSVDNTYTIPEITTGTQDFNFEYTTTTDDNCTDSAFLSFSIFQQYDPGESGSIEVCRDGGEIDLFTRLAGNPDANGTWTGPNGYSSSTNEALFDPATDSTGDYIYTVPANGLCASAQAIVSVTLGDADYAGEDTSGVEVCESTGSVDLFTLLNTNGTDTITQGGDFTDPFGNPIANPFVFPVNIPGVQTFSFTYTTPGTSGCQDQANLAFAVYEQYTAGTGDSREFCQSDAAINLYTLLTDTPDSNGTWSGPNGYTTTDNEAVFNPSSDAAGDYIYTVPQNGACESDQAIVSVSFGASDYAGEDTSDVELCETSGSIDLFTIIETNGTDSITQGGDFTDPFGNPVTNPFVFPANIPGVQTFSFTYTTPGTSGCQDQSNLAFAVYEQYTAGTGATRQICTDNAIFDLFSLLTDMPDDNGTWFGPNGYSTTDNVGIFDPSSDAEGDYVYTIEANGACAISTATVSIEFFDYNYAGEDTPDAQICGTAITVDLITLLNTNGMDTVYTGPDGNWTDSSGATVSNPFQIPVISGQETFLFTYSTTAASGCTDEAILTLTIFEQDDAGESVVREYCENQGSINLFSELGGTPDNTGSWTGPGGYTSSGTGAVLSLSSAEDGIYTYTIPSNGACAESTATVDVTIYEEVTAGNDVDTFLCPGDYEYNLSNLLDLSATRGGEFIDLATSIEVPSGIVNIADLGSGTFSYLYIVENGTCPQDDATIVFSITAVPEPTVSDVADFYCINDGITLGDLNVQGAANFSWFAFAEAGEELPLSTLLVDGQIYFVAAVDDNGCESNRVAYEADVRPLSDDTCQIEISNGVSDNDDGINDDLDLGTLPDIFPNYDLQIFNRYGTIVYKGNRNTPLFDGSSNTGSGLGDQLPTGVYFYIFFPNDANSAPIDGTFYLSR